MNRKVFKNFFVQFIFLFCVSFYGISQVNAETVMNDKTYGGIRCQYKLEMTNYEGTADQITSKIVIDIYYGKAYPNDYYTSWGSCHKFHGSSITDSECFDSESYKEVFHHADDYTHKFITVPNLGPSFSQNESNSTSLDTVTYKCPSSVSFRLFNWSKDKVKISPNLDEGTWTNKYNNEAGLIDFCSTNVSVTACANSDEETRLNENIDKAQEDTIRGSHSDASGAISDEEIDSIFNWGKESYYSFADIGDPCGAVDPSVQKVLNVALWIISIGAIILLIVMTAISFIKAITGSDDEKLRDAFKHLWIRILVVIILLLLPMLVGWIITLFNNNAGGTVKIGSDNKPFCDVTDSGTDEN